MRGSFALLSYLLDEAIIYLKNKHPSIHFIEIPKNALLLYKMYYKITFITLLVLLVLQTVLVKDKKFA